MNKVILIGNLTQDIELKSSQGGTSVCRFTVAVRRDYKNANGEYETDFISCVAFNKLAELMDKYCRKGDKIAVSGAIKITAYERDGEKRTSTDVVLHDIEFVQGKREEGERQRKPKISDLTSSDIPF